jgi:hypothetical protein
MLAPEFENPKKTGCGNICDISATRLSLGDPWAFRPTLADGLVLSSIDKNMCFTTGLSTYLQRNPPQHEVSTVLSCPFTFSG